MGLPSYKDIIDHIKAGATIEVQEKIMELRQSALETQEENIELRKRIVELEVRVRELESLEGEPCPRCRRRTWVLESGEPDPTFGARWRTEDLQMRRMRPHRIHNSHPRMNLTVGSSRTPTAGLPE